MSTKSGIRSLVCDPNGIIVAEMVYRCMICSAIHDVLDDAQRHYQTEHIEDNDINLKNSDQQLVPLDSDLEEEEEEELNMNYDMSDMFEDVDQNASNTVNVSVPGNLRQLQYQSNANSDSLIMNTPSMESYGETHRAKPITFAQPSNSFLLPYGGNAVNANSGKASPKRIGGGFVTCEVCGLTKYYSHISRRYGVFSCESCAKFFYRYLLKPSKFTCPNNGNCTLKIDVPGGRCKSCLLQACLQKYIIDPKKHPKIFQKSPAPGEKSGSLVPANVQIKTKPKVVNNASAKQSIKQEISMDERSNDSAHQVMPNLTTPKPSTNGIVIKATPQTGSAKRKQQFNEDGTAVTRSRRIGCRECPGCLADDCGQCLYCLDKPKFGGNDVKKQRCIKRRCHRANYT